MAGIIAALNNTVDVVGVAPKATVYAVKVLSDSGSGSDSAVIGGLDWVKANASSKGIRVVNMSLGRSATADDRSMHLAIQAVINVGVAVVVSAGNDPGVETSDLVPAGFPEVIAVASTTAVNGTVNRTYGYIAADTASYFTTDGAGVAISAPGEDQENLLAGRRISSVGILSLKVGGGTTRMSGTSMSAPHAAGVAALICQKFPLITPTGIGSRLGAGVLETSAPRDWLTSKGYTITSYSFDGMREGILHTTTALLP